MDEKNRIFSFSPTSGKFSPNNITIPVDSKISAMGTYLTYLYLADQKNNQIYRYPRAEGGFGEKTDWLKEDMGFSDMTGFAMNENIFVSSKDSAVKLFRGKKEAFDLEKTATPLEISAMELGKQSGEIFILDKENSRVIRFDGQGRIQKQYYHPEIGSASGISIDEKVSLIYFNTDKEIKSIPLQ